MVNKFVLYDNDPLPVFYVIRGEESIIDVLFEKSFMHSLIFRMWPVQITELYKMSAWKTEHDVSDAEK